MPRNHSEFMQIFFKDYSTGIDLGNIEIKESTKNYQKFTILPKDMASEFLLFYDHKSQTWSLARTNSFPEVIGKRSFRLSQVLEHCFFVTKNDFEIMREVHKVILDHSLVSISKESLGVEGN